MQRWLDDHPGRPITLNDLCQVAHVSRRSLIQGFREHLGMGPMRYLKLQRLHGARRTLLRADPWELTVTEVAGDHGFLNAGHFARDYQHLFGERPSDTLRQPGPRI
ncbi:MAG: helix-turn-helix domain-containing protein [Cyanobium sp.]